MFDEAMQTIIEHSSRCVSLVSAASLWLLYVLALTCLFVVWAGQVVPTRGSRSCKFGFDDDVYVECGVIDECVSSAYADN